jgi:hypothetical protein
MITTASRKPNRFTAFCLIWSSLMSSFDLEGIVHNSSEDMSRLLPISTLAICVLWHSTVHPVEMGGNSL